MSWPPITIHLGVLQYKAQPASCPFQPAIQYLYCNTIFFHCTPYIAIPCNTIPQPTCKPHCNTIPCIAIQFFQPNKPSCNTNSCLAIQLPSQNCTPKLPCHNIHVQMGSSPFIHCTKKKKFLVFFSLFIFFFPILFPATRNTQKKYPSIVFFFIFHPIHQIISYKFIFFIFFCFPHYKTLENDFLPLIFFFIILTQIYKNLFYSLFFNFTPCKTSENIFFISKPNKFIKI